MGGEKHTPRLGGLGGSKVQKKKEVRRIRKRGIGKKRDWKNGGISTRSPGASADFCLSLVEMR